ncbi:photosystem I reaction center subunit V [Iris pallida]|uniref:Photosystem I reaction center subunit V n=1 Tax=Iris pallida TaxID=29817 RepID=A0AAX6FD18_IRIPA|nr:photosystem I reaction center subunit V [Iris pallida]
MYAKFVIFINQESLLLCIVLALFYLATVVI